MSKIYKDRGYYYKILRLNYPDLTPVSQLPKFSSSPLRRHVN